MKDDLSGLDFTPDLTCEHLLCRTPGTKAIRYVVIACPQCRCGETYPVCATCYLDQIRSRTYARSSARTWVCALCTMTLTHDSAITFEQIKHW